MSSEDNNNEEHQIYSTIIEKGNDGIVIIQDHILKFVNPKMEDLLGFSPEEVINKPFIDFVAPGFQEFVMDRYKKRMAKIDVPEKYEFELVTKDGGTVPVEINASVIEYQGMPADMAIIRDISERRKAKIALRETQDMYMHLVETSPDGITITDLEGNFTFCNVQGAKLHGCESPEEFLALRKNAFDIIVPEDRERALENMYLTLEQGYIKNIEYRIITKNGDIVPNEVSASILTDAEGNPTGFIGITRDITERKKVERAVKESEMQYKSTIDSMTNAIHVVDRDYTILVMNQRFIKWNEQLGLETETIGKDLFEIFSFLPEKTKQEYEEVFKTGKTMTTEESNIIDGTEIITSSTKIPVFEGEVVDRIVTVIEDITERKLAQDALSESQQKYFKLIEESPEGIMTISPEGVITSINPEGERMFGFSAKELVGKPFSETKLLSEENLPKAMNQFQKTMQSSEYTSHEWDVQTKDKTKLTVDVRASLIMEKGELSEIMATIRDVTERKKAENAQKRSAERLEILHDIDQNLLAARSIEEIVRTALKGMADLVSSQRASVALFDSVENEVKVIVTTIASGETKGTEMTLPLKDLVVPEEVKNGNVKIYNDITNEDDGMGLMQMLIDSGIRSVLNVPITVNDELIGTLNLGREETGTFSTEDVDVANEVADSLAVVIFSRRAELALRGSEERFRNIFENATIGIYRTSPEGEIIMSNPALVDMLGYETFDELRNINLEEGGFAPQYRRFDFKERIENEGSVKGLESGWTRKDGSTVFVRESARAVWDDEENILYYEGTVEDISQRKKAEVELEKYQKHLEDLVKERTQMLEESNAELEAFAYSVSHDLRAPLRAMHGFSTALLEDYRDNLDEQGIEYAQRILTASKNMDKLIQDLLMYSRLTRVELEMDILGLERTLDEAMAQMEGEIHEKKAEINIKKPLPEVLGNPTTLILILGNIIGNGIKFTKPGKKPKITIWGERTNGEVKLFIQDNGIGIDPKYSEKIFRVFERLHGKNDYPGTGIGLAIVKKGLERMGGTVDFESIKDKGTKFWITLQAPEEKE